MLALQNVVFKINILIEDIEKIIVALGNVFNVQLCLKRICLEPGENCKLKRSTRYAHPSVCERLVIWVGLFFACSDPNNLFFPFDLEHRSYLLFADQVIWVKALE